MFVREKWGPWKSHFAKVGDRFLRPEPDIYYKGLPWAKNEVWYWSKLWALHLIMPFRNEDTWDLVQKLAVTRTVPQNLATIYSAAALEFFCFLHYGSSLCLQRYRHTSRSKEWWLKIRLKLCLQKVFLNKVTEQICREKAQFIKKKTWKWNFWHLSSQQDISVYPISACSSKSWMSFGRGPIY